MREISIAKLRKLRTAARHAAVRVDPVFSMA
jgi:hypothetical protein